VWKRNDLTLLLVLGFFRPFHLAGRAVTAGIGTILPQRGKKVVKGYG